MHVTNWFGIGFVAVMLLALGILGYITHRLERHDGKH